MGQEVSCGATAFILEIARERGLPQQELLTGLPYGTEHLKNRHERIDWAAYSQFLRNLRPFLTDPDFFEIGQAWTKSNIFRPWAVLARLYFNLGTSLPAAQRLMEKFGRQFFAGLSFQLDEIGQNGFRVTLKTKEGYKFCPEHFLIVKGSLSVIPAIRGFQTAEVTMDWIDRGATYQVTEPPKTKHISLFYKKIFWLFASKATMKEIIAAHDALILRYQDLEEARKELARYSQKLIEHREQERRRIANELHDDISGNLGSIALLGETLRNNLTLPEKEQKLLQEIPQIARQTTEAMRDTIWFINPENDSIQRLLAKMRVTADLMLETMEYSYSTSNDGTFPETGWDFRRNFYLFYKECLQNIIKHSKAEKVRIKILQNENSLQLQISDNGVGFDINKECNGNGLKNLRRRAADMGGEMEIISGENKGTTIRLSISTE